MSDIKIARGFNTRGANTSVDHTSLPRVQEGPKTFRDPRYPPMVQNGLTSDFDHAKTLHNPNFLVNSSGYTSPIPNWATGPFPTKSEGVQFKYGSGGHSFNASDGSTKSFDSRTSSVRVMDANSNQGNRTVYENSASPIPQVVDPFSGKTSMEKGHFYHDKKP